MVDPKTLDFPFLGEATLLLQDQGWDASADEVKYPIFTKSFPAGQCCFVYQAILGEDGIALTWLVHTRNDRLNALYGQIADTKFNDVPLRRTAVRRVVQNITPDDIVALTKVVEDWVNEESDDQSIDKLAQSSPRFAYQWLQRIAALTFLGKADVLRDLMGNSERPPTITTAIFKKAIAVC